ncbi:MAG: bifunctional YncE family protein/alkaline phosphatase family protein [Daejeonella sp.]|uniref:bifunctional YncE family protein/alkaline phosphatase family protein n=1 Tax=Daejeonella sp. TaxID=2805397 RepID=UPI002732F2FC|nr:bifunctional YncE family protein/alkaline phosphatase family protein [Daejeonella sp.]MDP3469211.1 bifunctional YncE family protein/alkaline phosphatase family protein [Daejeonella sp.]
MPTLLIICLLLLSNKGISQTVPNSQDPSKVLLPNGWSLSPAGRSIQLGDLPLNIQISESQRLMAVTNNGQSKHSIQLIDPQGEKILHEQPIGKAWYGLKFSADEKKLYASGANDNIILVYQIVNRKLTAADTLVLGKPWPVEKIGPTGLEVDDAGKRLYTVTKENNSLYVFDLSTKKLLHKVKLGAEAYDCLLSPDKSKLYISLWGSDKLAVYDTKTNRVTAEIFTENHPNEIIQNRNGKYLFVANANDNSVSVIDTQAGKVIEVISTALYPTRLTGSTTNGLALSEDEKTLYVANADNNCLAVFNVSKPGKSSSKGFIPTGWYPTNVRVAGKKIFVSNGKGFNSMPNPYGPQPVKKTDNSGLHTGITEQREVQYIGSLFKGTLSIIDQPDDSKLDSYSKQVYANTPYNKQAETLSKGLKDNPVPNIQGGKSPIKYVFYVIKENRTYDQVLGDMKEGNGDPGLCIFPERVTPNHHALAREFVLLDNFYVDAEVSADGHNWSTAAYATDYTEKTWPTSYGSRGGTYDYEGSRKIAYPRDGYIWDYCKRAGISYRSYGQFVTKDGPTTESLIGNIATKFAPYNLDIKDIDRIVAFKSDFDSLLAINSVAQFNTIRIGNDHTSGQRIGKLTPTAQVADNDLALGQLVEHISNSSIWKESAIFVLEDDAQNGPDHVDAHRSPAFVISPYTKRNSVNSNMYSTSGMLRTMELILGLPPMSQYDAAAVPLSECFTSIPDYRPYKVKPSNVDLEQRNMVWNKSAERSHEWNFAREDAAPDLDLNEVVWKSVMGEDSVMPAPRRSAFLKLEQKMNADD